MLIASSVRLVFRFLVFIGPVAGGAMASANENRAAENLLNTTKTNIGQPLRYPAGTARIQSLIVTMQPGQSTGVHMHPVPTYGHILEGEVTIDYGAAGKRTYRKGDTFMEATGHWHNGRNSGQGLCRILVVFIGANGVPNVVRPPNTK